MNISLIDYIGKVNNGIAILFSWIIDDDYYEFVFWFNKNNDYKIFTESNLTSKLGIDNMNDWEQIENFIIFINSIIPPKDEIFKEFDIEV